MLVSCLVLYCVSYLRRVQRTAVHDPCSIGQPPLKPSLSACQSGRVAGPRCGRRRLSSQPLLRTPPCRRAPSPAKTQAKKCLPGPYCAKLTPQWPASPCPGPSDGGRAIGIWGGCAACCVCITNNSHTKRRKREGTGKGKGKRQHNTGRLYPPSVIAITPYISATSHLHSIQGVGGRRARGFPPVPALATPSYSAAHTQCVSLPVLQPVPAPFPVPMPRLGEQAGSRPEDLPESSYHGMASPDSASLSPPLPDDRTRNRRCLVYALVIA